MIFDPPPAPLSPEQLDQLGGQVELLVRNLLGEHRQPSAWELTEEVEKQLGWKARWAIEPILKKLSIDRSLTGMARDFLGSLLESGDVDLALRGTAAPKREVISSVDALVHQSAVYRNSGAFREMVSFMAKFREYAPYNNMLVKVQNPSCGFYATQRDWQRKFGRSLKEDARPMLILAPRHPVLLVYDVDQTEGKPLPERLGTFARFEGDWSPTLLDLTVENAKVRDRTRVDFKCLSSTNAGFATLVRDDTNTKMRVAIHDQLDAQSRYGVLCHELAHIYLGHLGSDHDRWWPSRVGLDLRSIEIEAEATAYIVTQRAGLQGSSAAYVSSYLGDRSLPDSVSLDLIAKVAGRIEDMGRRKMQARREQPRRGE